MKAYADTSFLLALYRQQVSSPVANAVVKHLSEPLPMTALVELEARNGLNLGVSEFYSFDRRQCALAARCSLVVKPDWPSVGSGL
ncbi:MAG: hypothetical protein WCI17_05670 [bacterium]